MPPATRLPMLLPGTDDNDAVNYSQLKQQSAAARTEVRAGTNIKDVVKTVDTNGQDVYTVNAKRHDCERRFEQIDRYRRRCRREQRD